MPKIVEDVPSGVLVGRGRPRKYDWDTLFDGSAWLVEADELTVPPSSFVRVAHGAAKRRGLSLSTSIRPEGVYLLAVKAT